MIPIPPMTPELPWLRIGDGYVTVEINARPASRKRGVLKTQPSGPVIGLIAAPEKGRANRELIEFMAEVAGVPRLGGEHHQRPGRAQKGRPGGNPGAANRGGEVPRAGQPRLNAHVLARACQPESPFIPEPAK